MLFHINDYPCSRFWFISKKCFELYSVSSVQSPKPAYFNGRIICKIRMHPKRFQVIFFKPNSLVLRRPLVSREKILRQGNTKLYLIMNALLESNNERDSDSQKVTITQFCYRTIIVLFEGLLWQKFINYASNIRSRYRLYFFLYMFMSKEREITLACKHDKLL